MRTGIARLGLGMVIGLGGAAFDHHLADSESGLCDSRQNGRVHGLNDQCSGHSSSLIVDSVKNLT